MLINISNFSTLPLLFSCLVASTSVKHFDGFKLISINVTSHVESDFLRSLQSASGNVDFWHTPQPGHTCLALSPTSALSGFKAALSDQEISWTELDVNVARLVEIGMEKVPHHRIDKRSTASDLIDHHNYHDYDEIIGYIYTLNSSYPDMMEISYLPFFTHEGRRMITFKLQGTPSSSPKSSIIVEAGIHAREWISPAATLYSVEKILQQYMANDQTARFMLDSFDWHFVPSTNPDGYEYTRRSPQTRLWRKNRRMQYFKCVGVDLNRNFDIYFGTTGISKDCSSNIFPGVKPFSEPEAVNIKRLFSSLNDTLVAYLAVHSYSQVLLVPWSYSNAGLLPDRSEDLYRLGREMTKAMKTATGKEYGVGLAYDLLQYAASGFSSDWALSQNPDLFSYLLELRPTYTDPVGFLLPPNEIIPTGQELLAALRTMALKMTP